MPRNIATSPRRLAAAERRQRILLLRMEGWTLRDIGQELGLSAARAHQVLTAALAALATNAQETAEQLRALEAERLDGLWRTTYPAAIGGDLRAVDRCLRIMERRARLFGLDAPAKFAPTTPDGSQAYTGRGGLSALLAAAEAEHDETKH